MLVAVVKEFAKKADKATTSPDERVATIELEQAGDSAKAAADPAVSSATRDAVLEAHLAICIAKAKARSLTLQGGEDKRRGSQSLSRHYTGIARRRNSRAFWGTRVGGRTASHSDAGVSSQRVCTQRSACGHPADRMGASLKQSTRPQTSQSSVLRDRCPVRSDDSRPSQDCDERSARGRRLSQVHRNINEKGARHKRRDCWVHHYRSSPSDGRREFQSGDSGLPRAR